VDRLVGTTVYLARELVAKHVVVQPDGALDTSTSSTTNGRGPFCV
jgi:hypothetical protein